MSQADENLTHENRGSTIANKAQRKILVLIGPQTSSAEMLNTIAHEVYHVVGIVCEDCAKEHGAWLSGEIMMRMADIIYPS